MEFSWTVFFVAISFLVLFVVAWVARKAGPGDES